MKTAIFKNFSLEPFTGYWDGKPRTFKPGAEMLMPDYLAAHYAKHLTNRELLKQGKERSTSPKKPQEVPEYMELYNQACIPDEDVESQEADPIEVQIAVANGNRKKPAFAPAPGKPIEVKVDGIDEEEDDGEEMFEGKPVDKSASPEVKAAV